MYKFFCLLYFCCIVLIQRYECATILGIFYGPSYSHFILGEILLKELAARGHEVTMISSYPQKEKLKNYRDISINNGILAKIQNHAAITDFLNKSTFVNIFDLFRKLIYFTELSLQDESVQNFMKSSNETFDIIILANVLNMACFGFMHHFKAPLILMSSISSGHGTNTLMSNPTPYAYIPNLVGYSPKMNLFQRMYNTAVSLYYEIMYHFYVIPIQDKIMHTYFPDAPPLNELVQNTSLMLINSHPAIGTAVPLLPNMIEIGGFHVKYRRPLCADLKKFLDDTQEGVIYFSLGSVMQSKFLPEEKRQGILKAFSKLKLKVLWKFEDEVLPGKPENVRIEKWLPQASVLEHENVKLFITHGGRVSITESLYFGKPVIGVPIFAEQHRNIQEVVYLGYGILIEYKNFDEKYLTDALNEMLTNPRYAETAKYRSEALRSLKISPLEAAMSWIEYVIRHKGAPHLRNAGLELPWYQYMLLDVILLYLAAIWIFIKTFVYFLSKVGGKSHIKNENRKIKLKTKVYHDLVR